VTSANDVGSEPIPQSPIPHQSPNQTPSSADYPDIKWLPQLLTNSHSSFGP